MILFSAAIAYAENMNSAQQDVTSFQTASWNRAQSWTWKEIQVEKDPTSTADERDSYKIYGMPLTASILLVLSPIPHMVEAVIFSQFYSGIAVKSMERT